MQTFADLVASRKTWLADVLKPWCAQAALKDLKRAELEWIDIAGKVDAEKTLWFWAWGRFPDLVNADLSSIDEAHCIKVTLRDGRIMTGFPDARASRGGELVLVASGPTTAGVHDELGPFSLDEIATVARA